MSSKPVDTAIVMVVGPLIDDTDFKSLEGAIVYNAAGMNVSLIVEKTDGTSAVTTITLTTGGTSDWTNKGNGYYEVEITAAQNAEEGIGYIRGVCTGVLPFESAHYDIVKANVYDSLIKGTDVLHVDITQCGGSAVAAGAIPNAAADAAGGLPISDAGALDLDTKLANTNEITAARMGALTDWINGGRLDNLLDAIPTTAMRGTDNATLAATWSDARAGYLDNLSAGAVALASGVDLTKIHGVALTETIDGYLAAAFVKLFDVATPMLTASDVMRGTDSAYTGTPPTAPQIREEMDNNSTDLNAILADTNELQTNQGAWTTAVGFAVTGEYDTVIAALQTDLDNPAQYKADVSALATSTSLATAQADLDTITGADGVTLATAQALYAPNKVVPDAAGTLATYDPPTRTEATADKDAIIADIAALNDISVANIIAGITDDTLDLQEMMRIILAATAGKSSGGGTVTLVFRDAADSKARITATVDANGNRTAMTLDGA